MMDERLLKNFELAKKYNLKVDLMLMYSAFYEQHKNSKGSYKKYLGEPCYEIKMQERYDWIYDRIEETIISKHKYNMIMKQVNFDENLDRNCKNIENRL